MQPDQPRRTRGAAADPQHAAVSVAPQCLVVKHLGAQAGRLRHRHGAIGERGRVEVVGRGVHQVPRGGNRFGDGDGPGRFALAPALLADGTDRSISPSGPSPLRDR